MKKKFSKSNLPRIVIQWSVIGFMVLLAILPIFKDDFTPDFEAYCPFGGVQALSSYLLNSSLACTMTSVQISMGVLLIIGIFLFSKLFCAYICPIGTISEWLGKICSPVYHLLLYFGLQRIVLQKIRSLLCRCHRFQYGCGPTLCLACHRIGHHWFRIYPPPLVQIHLSIWSHLQHLQIQLVLCCCHRSLHPAKADGLCRSLRMAIGSCNPGRISSGDFWRKTDFYPCCKNYPQRTDLYRLPVVQPSLSSGNRRCQYESCEGCRLQSLQ
jgi:hypothetical protein